MQTLSRHPSFDCRLSDMFIESEMKLGLKSFKLRCSFCNLTEVVYSEDVEKNQLRINMFAISAANGAGVGFSVLEEIISGMDMPCVSNKTFLNYQNLVSELWNQEIEREIKENVRDN